MAPITPDSNIFSYLSQLLAKLAQQCDPYSMKLNGPPKITNTIIVSFKTSLRPNFWDDIAHKPKFREELIKLGEQYAHSYIRYTNK